MDSQAEESVLMQEVVVTLGGEACALKVKSLKGMGAFRRQAGVVVGRLVPLLDPVLEAFIRESVRWAKRDRADEELDEVDLSAFLKIDLAALIAKALPTLMGECPDDLIALAYAYAPELKAALDRAEYEEQVEAGMEVLALAFPFVMRLAKSAFRLGQRVRARAIGV